MGMLVMWTRPFENILFPTCHGGCCNKSKTTCKSSDHSKIFQIYEVSAEDVTGVKGNNFIQNNPIEIQNYMFTY